MSSLSLYLFIMDNKEHLLASVIQPVNHCSLSHYWRKSSQEWMHKHQSMQKLKEEMSISRAGKEKEKESPEGSTKATYKNPSFLPEFAKAITDSIIDGRKTVLTHPPLNRLCRSTSFLPFVTSSVLTVPSSCTWKAALTCEQKSL